MANGGRIGGRNVPGIDGYSGIWTPNEIADAARKGMWLQDPYIANVVALLHMNGADASTTFTDVKGHTFTPAGNAQIDTAQSKFGGASGLFDGTGDYIGTPSSADFAYGTGDFTWEFWARMAAIVTNQYFMDHGVGDSGTVSYYTGSLRYYNPGTGTGSALYTTTIPLSTNTWYHIAASRSAGTTRLFVDGLLKASGADSYNYGSQPLTFADRGGGGGFGLNGWLDDIRITKGVARYTANFIPPPEQLRDA